MDRTPPNGTLGGALLPGQGVGPANVDAQPRRNTIGQDVIPERRGGTQVRPSPARVTEPPRVTQPPRVAQPPRTPPQRMQTNPVNAVPRPTPAPRVQPNREGPRRPTPPAARPAEKKSDEDKKS